uniref:Rho GTPase n=1 Tax=Strongyloides venezuelensis TaxID=75913 RepID=A0A0K0FYH6_STRVS
MFNNKESLNCEKSYTFNNNTLFYNQNNLQSSDGVNKLKCVFVGDAGVGKTSLIVAYTTNGYPYSYTPTAFDNYSVTVWVDNKPIKLELSDTSGQSKFDTLRTLSYNDADAFLLCFNIMKPSSLNSILVQWLPEINKISPDVPLILVGTHLDERTNLNALMELQRTGQKPVDFSKGKSVADQLSAEYVECSALTQRYLKEVFDKAIVTAMNGVKEKKEKGNKFGAKINAKFQTAKAVLLEKQSSVNLKEGFRKFVSMTKKFI